MGQGRLLLFEGRETARAAFDLIVPVLQELGAYGVEEKKRSLHITNGGFAFLGVHPRKNGIRLNLVLGRDLAADRIAKVERMSRNRFHNEVDVNNSADVDDQLVAWIREACSRTANQKAPQ